MAIDTYKSAFVMHNCVMAIGCEFKSSKSRKVQGFSQLVWYNSHKTNGACLGFKS